MDVSQTAWIVTMVVTVVVLAFDVLVIARRPHEPSTKECASAIGLYSAAALGFTAFVWYHWGHRYAGEFVSGWLTEYSLSIDNLFIFLLILSRFKVPRHLQQFALMVGIILALVLRGVFIALGAVLIAAFSWVFFIFGVFLVYTAINLVVDYRHRDEPKDDRPNLVTRWAIRRFRIADAFHGTKLRVRPNGRTLMTPMFLVIIALGSTDLLFALDSIPTIYGLTQQAYLVFAANVFALMGLRQLYFLLGRLVTRLVYLSIGLSVILAFIGVKLVLHALHAYGLVGWEVPLWLSLVVIVATLAITTLASIVKSAATSPDIRPDTETITPEIDPDDGLAGGLAV